MMKFFKSVEYPYGKQSKDITALINSQHMPYLLFYEILRKYGQAEKKNN